MIAMHPLIPEIPRRDDVGPDPEPFADRFEVLLEIERRVRRTPVRLADHRRRDGARDAFVPADRHAA